MKTIKNRKKIYSAFKDFKSLNIKGILNNTDYQGLVDDLESPQIIWLKDKYFNFVYANNKEVVKTFDESITEGYFGFSGTNQVVYDYYLENGLIQWQNTCDQFHYEGDTFDINPLESLNLSDADTVNDNYEYKNETSLEKIKEAIMNRPSSCIRVGGQLVSYVLLHDDDSIGYMYTLPDYRGKGYAYDLTRDIVNKTIESGRIPYIQIVQSNHKSIGLALKAGFVKHGEVHWFGVCRTGDVLNDSVKLYEGFYNEKPVSVSFKANLRLKYKALDVEVTDSHILYDGKSYGYQSHYDDETYFIYADMPEDILISGLMVLVKEDYEMILTNQDIKSKCFKRL